MSTEQPIDPQVLEETKQQIRGLVQEIQTLSKAEIAPTEFYDQFLNRVVQALAAVGGVVWTVGDGGRLELAYQINLQEAGLVGDPAAQQRHGRLLQQTLASGEGRLVPPYSGGDADDEAGNPTGQLLVLGPLAYDREMHGLVEIFQRPGGAPSTQRGYLRFLQRMCEYASDYLKNRQLRQLGDRQALYGQFSSFTLAVHNSLDLRETAYTLANEGRRLIECDRVSVAIRRGRQCRIEGISGQDTFDKRSNTVMLLNRLATAVVRTGEPMWYTGDTSQLAPQVEQALDEYIDDSHSKTVAVLPLFKQSAEESNALDEPRNRETIGALIVEQIENSRPREGMLQRVDVVTDHGSRAITNCLEHNNVFLMPLWRTIGKSRVLVSARHLPKTLAVVAGLAIVTLCLLLVPWNFELEGRGTLQPKVRRDVFASVGGLVTDVYVRHGDIVPQDAPLAKLKNVELNVEIQRLLAEREAEGKSIESSRRELFNSQLEASERLRVQADIKSREARLLGIQEQLAIYDQMMQDLVVRSPIAGQIITWDVMNRLQRRTIQQGQSIITVADPNGEWELEVNMPEDRMGHIMQAQKDLGELKVSYIVASDPGEKFQGTVYEIAEIAEAQNEEGTTVLTRVDIDKTKLKELRPGTTVTAKIYCGRRPLGYVLFHDLMAWIRSRVLFRIF